MGVLALALWVLGMLPSYSAMRDPHSGSGGGHDRTAMALALVWPPAVVGGLVWGITRNERL